MIASTVPRPVLAAIHRLVSDVEVRALACRLFADDTATPPHADDVAGARLEHAIARTELDAWASGMATAEDVGAAYARLALALMRSRSVLARGLARA
jgi:hypothetical protein